MNTLFRNIIVASLGCVLVGSIMTGCTGKIRGTIPGGFGGGVEVEWEVGDEVRNLPAGYTLCPGSPREMEGYTICEYCSNSSDPLAPRFVQINCTGGYRKVSPMPIAATPKLASPPNGRIEFEGALEADANVLTKWDGEVKLMVSFNAERALPTDPESSIKIDGLPMGSDPVLRVGSELELTGAIEDVAYDAYRLGIRSLSVKGVLGTLELKMVPDLGLCEVWVNGELEGLRFITR